MNDKQTCAADPMAFGRRYLGHYFTVSSPTFHRQLEQFPLGRHDDGPDALEGVVRLCKQGGGCPLWPCGCDFLK